MDEMRLYGRLRKPLSQLRAVNDGGAEFVQLHELDPHQDPSKRGALKAMHTS